MGKGSGLVHELFVTWVEFKFVADECVDLVPGGIGAQHVHAECLAVLGREMVKAVAVDVGGRGGGCGRHSGGTVSRGKLLCE